MLDHPLQDIETWVLLFSSNSLPVLRITKQRIDQMRNNIDQVDARELAKVILQDPVMTVRVLAFIQPLHGRSLQHDITTIASALMMAGLVPFFKRFEELFTVEDMLKRTYPQALLGVLHTIRRAQRSADYAQEWALWRHDLNIEEVRIAALLHDLAEILVWCSAPVLCLKIKALRQSNPCMRSSEAQLQVLGLTFQDIQLALCRMWHLPALLQTLIDDDNSQQPRVRTVSLAVRLARHSANSWDDPALPDDIKEIGNLLNISPEAVRQRLGLLPMPAVDPENT